MIEKLVDIIEKFRTKTIGVIGDIVLDHFIFGFSRRLSREAPIPVVEVESEIYAPGCAGNAAANLATLGAQTIVFGFIGNDQYSANLQKAFSQYKNINLQNLTIIPSFSIPVKTRVFTSQNHTRKQQVARIDRYKVDTSIQETFWEITLRKIDNIKNTIDGFIISDYNYLLLSNEIFIEQLKKILKGKTVIVDTHRRFNLLKGFTIFTPNEEEANTLGLSIARNELIKIEEQDKTLSTILNKLEAKILVVTLGKKGIIVKEQSRKPIYMLPFLPTEAIDTTGAGDTVAVTFLLSYLISNDIFTSVLLSQIAANVVIQKIGTVPCESLELIRTIERYREYIHLFYQQQN